nr:MAG TPA: hypothetical protein [Caudoviricetes sp.]
MKYEGCEGFPVFVVRFSFLSEIGLINGGFRRFTCGMKSGECS